MKGRIMKSAAGIITKLVAVLSLVFVVSHATSAQTAAQEKGRIRLDSIDRLFAKAGSTVDVDVDGNLIKIGVAILSEDDPEEKAIRELALSLKGVYVRRLEFKTGGQYAESDLADIRAQLRAPGWSKVVDVSGGARDWEIEDAEIYVATENGQVAGMVVIAAEPKSLTVANVVGALDLDKLKRLGGTLGLPKIRIERRKVTITTEKEKTKKP